MKKYVAAIVLAMVSLSAIADDAARRCDDLYQFTDETYIVEPGVLVEASGSTPAYCRVQGVIDGTSRFRVGMPVEGWNGRMMYHAPGGLAGFLGDTHTMLKDGYAQATFDGGHSGGVQRPEFYNDPARKLNFAFRGNNMAAELAKRIIAKFYGNEVEYSYMWGCSNGGRAGVVQGLRYPDVFDGIIAGDPAVDYGTGMLAYTLEIVRHQNRNPLTPAAVDILDANSEKQCDMLDGLADGIIGDPRNCTVEKLELEKLQCKGAPADDCLTAGQVETATFIYEGVKDKEGNIVVGGVYPGNEANGDFQLWVTGAEHFMVGTASEKTVEVTEIVMSGEPGFNLETFDPVEGMDRLGEIMVAVNPPAPDFSRFADSGAKMIIYSGWHDIPVRAKSLEAFYQQALEINGQKALDDTMRMFMVPGMVHCVGGSGAWSADYIQAIVDWVEKGQAPDRMIAENPGEMTFLEAHAVAAKLLNTNNSEAPSMFDALMTAGDMVLGKDRHRFSRPLCPYPSWAKYTGNGDPDDAKNFRCVTD